ncbi:MAG: HIT domain-containing protein [Planctomycetota bacterium]|nr:HIT domain-containing protein [Planctomycetota bacterium]
MGKGEAQSGERQRNLWAPWRMEYIDALNDGDESCFLCRYRDEPENDQANLVLWRGQKSFVMMNRFPYTGGHSMIAPYEHQAGLADLADQTLTEMVRFVRDLESLLSEALNAEGFNVGLNVGRCAGAGLPGHLHAHVVPRWPGDTNFVTVLGGVRVIPQSLQETWTLLRETSQELNLPRL